MPPYMLILTQHFNQGCLRLREVDILGPEEHRFTGEFRAVIADDMFCWRATFFNELSQEASDLVPRY